MPNARIDGTQRPRNNAEFTSPLKNNTSEYTSDSNAAANNNLSVIVNFCNIIFKFLLINFKFIFESYFNKLTYINNTLFKTY
jgi:hypothetical protein